MAVRKTTAPDLPVLLEIYAYAREQMKKNGNPHQWGDTNPAKAVLENDIACGNAYVVEHDGEICGVFTFIIGEDDTYARIDDGAWLSSDRYGTIHRVASGGRYKGILHEIVEFCGTVIPNLRIDTHHDNHIMQGAIAKEGFTRCGIIYVRDGSPRIAYQKLIDSVK